MQDTIEEIKIKYIRLVLKEDGHIMLEVDLLEDFQINFLVEMNLRKLI